MGTGTGLRRFLCPGQDNMYCQTQQIHDSVPLDEFNDHSDDD